MLHFEIELNLNSLNTTGLVAQLAKTNQKGLRSQKDGQATVHRPLLLDSTVVTLQLILVQVQLTGKMAHPGNWTRGKKYIG